MKRHPECWTCVAMCERTLSSKEDYTNLKQILRHFVRAIVHRRAAQDDGTNGTNGQDMCGFAWTSGHVKQRANGRSPSKEDYTNLKQILRRFVRAILHRRAAQDDGTNC